MKKLNEKKDTIIEKVKEVPKKIKNKVNRIKYKSIIISSILTFIICLGIFGLFYNFYLKKLVIETTKEEITITDTGLSEAVSKVYDSVVVIETLYNNKAYSSGTGFVFKEDDKYGYILTNNHVIENATEVYLTFTNNKKIKANIVGNDAYSDVAVLSIDKENIISIADIGSSENLKIGDTTFAVGAPIDSETYSWTVTRGILSGKDRMVEVTGNNGYSSSVMEVLQTDAAINSGNSGGPLCNVNGEVIGITNMKLASDTIEGMGFAIPIETAIKYANSFITGEKITRPYLGVSIYDAELSFFSDREGVYIESVESGSSADKAGLKKGDKLLKIGDDIIKSSSYFKYKLYKYNIGDTIKITYERDGKEESIEVKLGSSNTTA